MASVEKFPQYGLLVMDDTGQYYNPETPKHVMAQYGASSPQAILVISSRGTRVKKKKRSGHPDEHGRHQAFTACPAMFSQHGACNGKHYMINHKTRVELRNFVSV